MNFDIIVVGGGHAGCEASYSSAKMGLNVALITANKKNIADMPCNPHIGGTAKGIVVREIDALGGIMGKVADRSHIQIKMLNNAKGPAVRSLRAQADKITYPKEMLKMLTSLNNLSIIEAMVENILVEDKKIVGIELSDGKKIFCKALILTTGTYLKSKILVGDTYKYEGPHGEKRSNYLSDKLKQGITYVDTKIGENINPDTYAEVKEETSGVVDTIKESVGTAIDISKETLAVGKEKLQKWYEGWK